jgi:hypothetical protein
LWQLAQPEHNPKQTPTTKHSKQNNLKEEVAHSKRFTTTNKKKKQTQHHGQFLFKGVQR